MARRQVRCQVGSSGPATVYSDILMNPKKAKQHIAKNKESSNCVRSKELRKENSVGSVMGSLSGLGGAAAVAPLLASVSIGVFNIGSP